MTRKGESILSTADKDLLAEQVLELVRGLVRGPLVPRINYGIAEPTGISYATEMAPWVEKRSDERRR